MLSEEECTFLRQCKLDEKIKNDGDTELYNDLFYTKIKTHSDMIVDSINKTFDNSVFLDGFNIKTYSHMNPKNKNNGMNLHRDNLDWVDDNGRWTYCSWRTYTAITLLNSNFIGGECLIEVGGKVLKEKIPMGRTHIFESGLLHGCASLIYGTRFALILWYRSDGEILNNISDGHYLSERFRT